MSIRYLGNNSSPYPTPLYNVRIRTPTYSSTDQQVKQKKMNKYKEELDRQVEENNKRKLLQREQQLNQERKRQRELFENAKSIQQQPQTQQHLPRQQSRLAKVGKSRLAFQPKSKNIQEFSQKTDINLYGTDNDKQIRIKTFALQLDSKLKDLYSLIETSKSRSKMETDQQFMTFKRKLKTQHYTIEQEDEEYNQYEYPLSRVRYDRFSTQPHF